MQVTQARGESEEHWAALFNYCLTSDYYKNPKTAQILELAGHLDDEDSPTQEQ